MSRELASDVLALKDLAYRYASGVDRRDRERFLSVFRENSKLRLFSRLGDDLEVASTREGLEELGQIPGLISRYTRTFHFVGNQLYDVDGDAAQGEVYCMARHLSADRHGGTDYVILIRYEDSYSHDGTAWFIAERHVIADWSEVQGGVFPSADTR
jgi:hypothetical protein